MRSPDFFVTPTIAIAMQRVLAILLASVVVALGGCVEALEMGYGLEEYSRIHMDDQKLIRDGYNAWRAGRYLEASVAFSKFEGNENHKVIQIIQAKIYAEGLAGTTDLAKALELHKPRFLAVEIYRTENFQERYEVYLQDVCEVVSSHAESSVGMKAYAQSCLFFFKAGRRDYMGAMQSLEYLRTHKFPLGFELYGHMLSMGRGESQNISKAIEAFHSSGILYLIHRDRSRAQLQEDNIRRLDPNHPLLQDLQRYLYGGAKLPAPEAPPQPREDPFELPEFPKDIKNFLARV